MKAMKTIENGYGGRGNYARNGRRNEENRNGRSKNEKKKEDKRNVDRKKCCILHVKSNEENEKSFRVKRRRRNEWG